MCESIINSEYLVHTNSEFWIECFHIIKCILATVDYKGVREIMKVNNKSNITYKFTNLKLS